MDGISLLAHQIQGFLSSHLPLSKTKQLHALIITSSLLDPSFALTKLLRLYGLNGALTCARSMFEEIPERSVYAWNAMIRANARRSDFDGAFSLFLQMLRTGAGPDSHTFACILRACAEMPHGRRAASTHGKLISCGLGTDPLACSSLITAYAKLGSVDLAGRVFRAVQEPDLVLWNSMLSAYAHCGYCLTRQRRNQICLVHHQFRYEWSFIYTKAACGMKTLNFCVLHIVACLPNLFCILET
ncbi:unnamed protein product [Spirodela intermedia]|uniref:Uncharacterized protein n=1 Tax=Spirodela intermedia TaxID=51605 RepID=A0A7I8J829_SPIIN|nr:unnamed protein product [Spirodela intermedia]CAA6665582.1 unnamed protein product [Spirodela intermedia]